MGVLYVYRSKSLSEWIKGDEFAGNCWTLKTENDSATKVTDQLA